MTLDEWRTAIRDSAYWTGDMLAMLQDWRTDRTALLTRIATLEAQVQAYRGFTADMSPAEAQELIAAVQRIWLQEDAYRRHG